MRTITNRGQLVSFTDEVDGWPVTVTVWGIDDIMALSPEDQSRIHSKIARIAGSRREWGTDHVGDTPLTIRVQRRI